MTSDASICNRALDKLGQTPITSLGDDSKPARACNRMYAAVRDAVLRDHPWNCAIARASLAALVDAPGWGYAAQYHLPDDCLRVLEVDTNLVWKVEGRAVVTDAGAPLNILYVRRVTDAGQFDALFVDALAARLAAELSEPLTQSNTKRKAAEDAYGDILARARNADGQEGAPDPIAESGWVTVRF